MWLVLLLGLALAPAAGASSITVHSDGIAGEGGDLGFSGDPGRNDVTVSADAEGSTGVRVRDESAELTAPPECSQIDAHEVVCSRSPWRYLWMRLEGGDDRVRVHRVGLSLAIEGGDGDDVVNGAQGPAGVRLSFFGDDGTDILMGGPGDELMSGGRGRDEFRGGEGNDEYVRLHDSPDEANVIDGGAGRDNLRYAEAGYDNAVAEVDLAAGTDSDGDELVSIENVYGAGTASGGGGTNLLEAGRFLTGGPGDDLLTISAGYVTSSLDGGAGNDALWPISGSDTSCGDGSDLVTVRDRTSPLIRDDCEWLQPFSAPVMARQPTAVSHDGVASFALPCEPGLQTEQFCRVTLLVRGVAKPLRRVRWARRGGTVAVDALLPADVRRVVAAGRHPAVSVYIGYAFGPKRKGPKLRQVPAITYRTSVG
jgi:hypothetical protein